VTATATATPTRAADEKVVVAAGDIACGPSDPYFNGGAGTYDPSNADNNQCHMLATSNRVLGMSPDAVFTLGDNQYEEGTLTEFNGGYHPSWGRFKGITYPSVGNHEYHVNGAAGYFGYFGAAAGDPAKGYYSFNLGNWHIIAMNTNRDCTIILCGPGSTQEQWLINDLQTARTNGFGDCTLAYWHHPRWSTGSHGNDPTYDALWRALYAAGAEIVLNGHDHADELFHPQDPGEQRDNTYGIRQFIVGTGGKHLTTSRTNGALNSAWQSASKFSVLRLALRSTDYAWDFVAEDGTILNSGSGTCHGQPPQTTTQRVPEAPRPVHPPRHEQPHPWHDPWE
jgi:hypothetical protein